MVNFVYTEGRIYGIPGAGNPIAPGFITDIDNDDRFESGDICSFSYFYIGTLVRADDRR